MAYKAHSQDVPVEYMDLQTLWNDRRDPHANPLSSSPRREGGRAPGPGKLQSMLDQIYRPSDVFDIKADYPLASKRLYGGANGGR